MPAQLPSLPACLLDPRVIAITQRLMVWDLPAERRPLRLASASGEVSELYAPWPRLLLAAVLPVDRAPELHVVAVRWKGRIQPGTKLCHAPLMNIDVYGRFNDSRGILPFSIDPRRIDEWTRALVDFPFTFVGHDQTLRPSDMAARAQINSYHHGRCWRELARAGLERFPGRSLVPRRETFEQWLFSLHARTF